VAGRGLGLPLEFENVKQKKVVFLVFSEKKTNFATLAPPQEKIWKNPLVLHPRQNPSDALFSFNQDADRTIRAD